MFMSLEINTLAVVLSVTDNYTLPKDDMILAKRQRTNEKAFCYFGTA